MTNTIFTSKEQYFSFRAAWATSVNNKDIKITAEHHMLYNALRGKDLKRGFTQVTNTNKTSNGVYYNHSAFYASLRLEAHQRTAIVEQGEKNISYYLVERMKAILAVFQGTVTVEMLASMPKIDKILPEKA